MTGKWREYVQQYYKTKNFKMFTFLVKNCSISKM